jgi:hypothetical protein
MWRHGIFSSLWWDGIQCINTQSLHGAGFSLQSKFMQVGESSKMNCGLHGSRGERP